MSATVRIVTSEGRLVAELPEELAAALAEGSEWGARLLSSEALLLLKVPVGGRVLAGDLETVNLEELFGWILAGLHTGKLILSSGTVRKTVSFSDGQAVFATSTETNERLGASLVKLGLISREQLDAALAEVSPKRKLGQVLLETAGLPSGKLYSAMTFTVREIVVGLFAAPASGTFVFLDGQPPADALKMVERTRDLVLEGLTRATRPVAPQVGGAVATESGELAIAYAQFVHAVAQQLVDSGVDDGSVLKDFFAEAPPGIDAAFEGVSFTAEAGLDLEAVRANTARAHGSDAPARLTEALEAFAAYALFTAKNLLEQATSTALEDRLKALQRRRR